MNYQRMLDKIAKTQSSQKAGIYLDASDYLDCDIVVWGAGVSGRNFLRVNSSLAVVAVIDTREHLQGNCIFGIKVHPVEFLDNLNPKNVVVVLANEIPDFCESILSNKGFENIFIPDRFLATNVSLNCKSISPIDFLSHLTKNNVNYVVERKSIVPEFSGEVDVLIDGDGLKYIFEMDCFINKPDDSSWILDLSLAEPLGLENEILPYPTWVAKMFLENRVLAHDDQYFVMNEYDRRMASFYHDFVHLGKKSALLCSNKGGLSGFPPEYSFIDDVNIFDYFKSSAYYPGIDFIRKWRDFNQSDFLKSELDFKFFPPYLSVYILREHFMNWVGGMNYILKTISEKQNIVQYGMFDADLCRHVSERIRGGVWCDNEASRRGGGPVGFIIAKNHSLRSIDAMLDVTSSAKKIIRDGASAYFGYEVNVVHSSDDSLEAEEFLKVIGLKSEDIKSI